MRKRGAVVIADTPGGSRRRRRLRAAITVGLCLLSYLWSGAAVGISFLTFDARSIAMGGAGVATARSHNAGLFNPALLVNRAPGRDGFHAHGYAGARLHDRDDFLGSAREFRGKYRDVAVGQLIDDAIDLTPSTFSDGDELRSATAVIRELQGDVNRLSDKPLRASASFGFAFSHPAKPWFWGGYARRYLVLGSVVRIAAEDNSAIDRVTQTVDLFADLIDQVTEAIDLAGDDPGITLAEAVDRAEDLLETVTALDAFVAFDRLLDDVRQDAIDGKNLPDYLREPLPDEFLSTIESQGAEVTEQALSLARSVRDDLHVGISLKHVQFTTISFSQRVDEFDIKRYRDPEHRAEHARLNVDLGLLYDVTRALQAGVVILNLVPYDFGTVDGQKIALRPIARAGIGYTDRNLRISIDLDLTRNEPLGFDPDKQYLSTGVEWFVWRNTALRAGMRTNLVDREALPSFGIGIGGLHGHVDLAVARAGNENEWGVGLQAGLAF